MQRDMRNSCKISNIINTIFKLFTLLYTSLSNDKISTNIKSKYNKLHSCDLPEGEQDLWFCLSLHLSIYHDKWQWRGRDMQPPPSRDGAGNMEQNGGTDRWACWQRGLAEMQYYTQVNDTSIQAIHWHTVGTTGFLQVQVHEIKTFFRLFKTLLSQI